MIDIHRPCRTLGFLLALLVGQASVPNAQAQLVQVGPGFVRAPFVRVYWGPDGSSYVRAPFVSTYSPGYWPQGYWPQGGPLPADCQRMNWAALVRTINESARQLDADLTQLPAGDPWRTQLNTKELATLAPADPQQPPPEELRLRMLQMLPAFDNMAAMPSADWVGGRVSFQMLQAALREYTIPAEQRLRRQLIDSARDLQNSLTRFATGATWQSYLALPPEFTAAATAGNPRRNQTTPNDLAELVGRFEMVSHNDAYRMIAALPAFHWAQESLVGYSNWLQSRSPAPVEEELPAPSPEK
jgi:hypothetical protein